MHVSYVYKYLHLRAGQFGLEDSCNDGNEHVSRGWADVRSGPEADPSSHGEGLVSSLPAYVRLSRITGQPKAQASPLLIRNHGDDDDDDDVLLCSLLINVPCSLNDVYSHCRCCVMHL